jgi:hypothetical protein
MWYTSTQSFGNRIEAITLAVGADCLVVANGVQPVRRDGFARDGRVQLRRAGTWEIDYVRLPFRAGTCHVSTVPADRHTVAGGTGPEMDTHPEIATELSNLPAVVQAHLESYVPAALRIRRWVGALGPTAVKPERLWLFTTSQDKLAYSTVNAGSVRTPPDSRKPRVGTLGQSVLTAIIGPASGDHVTLADRGRRR